MASPRVEPTGSKLPAALSFWLIAVILGLFLFAASAPSPLYAIYAARFHFSPSTLTAINAVYAFGALLALLTTGRLSDRLGRRPVLILGLVTQIAGMVAFIGARGVGALYAARILQGWARGSRSAQAAHGSWISSRQRTPGLAASSAGSRC